MDDRGRRHRLCTLQPIGTVNDHAVDFGKALTMARREPIDALMARVASIRTRTQVPQNLRDIKTLRRRMDAGELPTDLDAAIAALAKARRATDGLRRANR